MPAQDNVVPDEQYYYIDSSKTYTRTRPHPTQNLISLYNLDTIAESVARLNEDGTKGVKLRKSYKAHMTDLSAKSAPIGTVRTLSPVVFAPEREGAPIRIEPFEPTMLKYNVSFDRTPETGIPGFDPAELGIGDGNQGTKRKSKNKGDESQKRRRVD